MTVVFLSCAPFPCHGKERLRFLSLGDSHTYGVFGTIMQRMLSNGRASITSVGRCGASAGDFVTSGDHRTCGTWTATSGGASVRTTGGTEPGNMAELLRAHEPDVLLLQLGGNMMNLTEEESARQLRLMAAAIRDAGRPCVWIGPNTGPGRDPVREAGFYRQLSDIVGDACAIIDSRPLARVPEGYGDGVHFDQVFLHDMIASGGCPVLTEGASAMHGERCRDGVELAADWARGVYRALEGLWPAIGEAADPDLASVSRLGIHGRRILRQRIESVVGQVQETAERTWDRAACYLPRI